MGGDLAFFTDSSCSSPATHAGVHTVLLHPSGLGEREEQAAWMGLQISTWRPQRDGGGKWNSLGKTGPKCALP